MNKKKLLLILLPLLAVTLVSATLLAYFGRVEQTIDVVQAVTLKGCGDNICTETTEISGGETALSEEYNLKSETSVIVPVKLDTSIDPDEEGIETTIIGTLELTKKDVDFSNDVWAILEGKVNVDYVIVGDKFSAEVNESIEDYVLIYYKDNSDRFNEPAEAILIEGNDFPYLPYKTDRNSIEDGTYNYCDTGEYDTCYGAKIWYVPETAINPDKTLDWSRASEFYFETELIEFNKDGEITIYPDEELDFRVKTSFSTANAGMYTITTEAKPR